MSAEPLTILKAAVVRPSSGGLVVDFAELRARMFGRQLAGELLRDRDVHLRTYRLATLPRPFATAALVRMLGRGTCTLEDEAGTTVAVSVPRLLRMGGRAIRDALRAPLELRSLDRRMQRIASAQRDTSLDRSGVASYLRTDLWFGVQSGGSVGHIAGVVNHLDEHFTTTLLLTTDAIPTVHAEVATVALDPGTRFWDWPSVTPFAANRPMLQCAESALAGRRPGMIYQRYSLGNIVGLDLARRFGVPFVLEYNGSEVWINRNWGKPLKYERLAERIELANLHGADLVVVVSDPMREELVGRGVDPGKILVNPNGVDPEVYSPDVDGREVRRRFGLQDKVVIGFIGTFGPWHGAEVLATAFGRLVERRPDLATSVRLLMIGDGPTMPETRQRIRDGGVEPLTVFAGRTAQADGPAHLAACDLLVSPHVPNPDGTPFFGSPTKLFEYMAMGKPIVASDLSQIGEVLDHGATAWLVRPGDPGDLATGIAALIDDPVRAAALGRAARERAVSRHTWRAHTERIVEALRDRCA